MRFRMTLLLMALMIGTMGSGRSVYGEVNLSDGKAKTYDTRKPWTRWWWMGNAVDKQNISRSLETFKAAGIGGVELTFIYGVKGQEDRDIAFLSDQWAEMVRHTVEEGKRLGLGVDIAVGAGWRLGGPMVEEADGDARLVITQTECAEGSVYDKAFGDREPQALMAFGDDGKRINLSDRISDAGRIAWTAPAGKWTVYEVGQKYSGANVKRPAPGGSGRSVNPYSRKALRNVLDVYGDVFEAFDPGSFRSMFHDSYEYTGDWCDSMFDAFEKRRGYDLREQLPALTGVGEPDLVARVKSDYRETASDVLLDAFPGYFSEWAHARGALFRNQAHGSPANLLDMYAACDIPETELFGRGEYSLLVNKFASSAANIMGKPLVSSESCTWLDEHFNVTLAQMKSALDDLFLAGVNHHFFHGTVYSPADAPWPGWLFYASTQYNPNNPIWRDAPALNRYIAQTQSFLQSGHADNDLLIYWPVYDHWHNSRGLMQKLTVHGDDWIRKLPVGDLAQKLWDRGYTFDFVSDRQLEQAHVGKENRIVLPGGHYRALVMPRCERAPVATVEKAFDLMGNGARVVVQDHWPQHVPGFDPDGLRGRKMRSLIQEKSAGREVGPDVETLLGDTVPPETMGHGTGLKFLRRKDGGQTVYFIVNRGEAVVDDWFSLTRPFESIELHDPERSEYGEQGGGIGRAALRQTPTGARQFRLKLEPGESIVAVCLPKKRTDARPWDYNDPMGDAIELKGVWSVQFIDGGPALPAAYRTDTLKSWTEQDDPKAESFAGAARYRLEFDAPAVSADKWMVDLGRVFESARVFLNGVEQGVLFTSPYRLTLKDQTVGAPALKQKGNVLEIEVTNVAANRIRDLDRRGVQWRIFHDINFVNKNYKAFDASKWPVREAGLIGPVHLIPLKAVQ